MNTEHPNPETLWRHRRRGFYAGIHGLWLQTLLWIAVGAYSVDLIAALSVVISFAYGGAITLIIQYSANTAVEEWAKRGAR